MSRIIRNNEEVRLPLRLRRGDRLYAYCPNMILMRGERLRPVAQDTLGNDWAGPWVEYRKDGCRSYDGPGEGLRAPDLHGGA